MKNMLLILHMFHLDVMVETMPFILSFMASNIASYFDVMLMLKCYGYNAF